MLEVDKKGDRKYDFINPFIPNTHVLYPTQTETSSFSEVVGGRKRVHWEQMS